MPGSGSNAIDFAVTGTIERADLLDLCGRICSLLTASRATLALCDVRSALPDAVTVDALARLQLAARRLGCQVCFRDASDELLELVAFMGLEDVLGDWRSATPD